LPCEVWQFQVGFSFTYNDIKLMRNVSVYSYVEKAVFWIFFPYWWGGILDSVHTAAV